MTFSTNAQHDLHSWLSYIECQHTQPIALGLDRVRAVSQQLAQRQTCPVIMVGGTNGKGSTCALLESVLRAAGYRVGLYTSPHLLHYRERVRINGASVSDTDLVASFTEVERARGVVPLTYFEFGTLAAWQLFARQPLDAIILEVGLGGRLDAVNIYTPSCAIVTTVDLDHREFLGDTREAIGFEKAGIFRRHTPALYGDANPPQSLLDQADKVHAKLHLLGRDFGFMPNHAASNIQWQYWCKTATGIDQRSSLPLPALRGGKQLNNASVVIAALESLREVLPVSNQEIRRGLLDVYLPARFQVLPGRPTIILDVAHNPQAAQTLAASLRDMPPVRCTWAVFGMLRDKDIAGVIAALNKTSLRWLPCTLESVRGARATEIAQHITEQGLQINDGIFASPLLALQYAQKQAEQDDRIIVFGSFMTVAAVMPAVTKSP